MTTRTTLTKSLHTVSVVTRVALALPLRTTLASLLDPAQNHANDVAAVRNALDVLGMQSDWPETDETFAKCVRAVSKARS